MRIVETIKTSNRMLLNNNQEHIVYYGYIDNDPIITTTYTDEKQLDWLTAAITGKKYSYTMTITDE